MTAHVTPESVLLTDRRAVVTGAARGIGRATALALARFGADVAVCDRLGDELAGTVAEIEALGRSAPSAVLDVRDPPRWTAGSATSSVTGTDWSCWSTTPVADSSHRSRT